ncbi:MAG TPA: MFS transporter [Clostridia bacterium]
MIFLLVIIYLAFISLGLPDSLLGTAWPTIYTKFGVPLSYAGILSFTVSCGTIISSFFSAKIIRRFKTGLTTAVSVALTAFALIGISFSINFWMILLFCVPLGLGAGSVDAALNNYVALHYKARHMNWLHCFWGIGVTASPLIMSFWLNKGSWQSGYLTVGLIQTGLVIILFLTLPMWNRVGKIKQSNQDKIQENKVISLKEIIKIKGAKPVLLAFLCYCAVECTAGLWGNSFLVIAKGIEVKTAASWISLYYFGITLGRFISGLLTVKMSDKSLIRLGQVLILIGIVLLFIPSIDFIMCVAFFVIGLGCAPIYPSIIHSTPNNFGADISQSIMGIQMACAYIGSTFMPPLFGLIAQYINISLLPAFLLLFCILMIIMCELLNKTKRNSTN